MLKFYHWQTKLSIVFLEMTDYFFRFYNACQILKSAEPWFVSHLSLSGSGVLREKVALSRAVYSLVCFEPSGF